MRSRFDGPVQWGIWAALLVFDGCVSFSKSYPEKHYYTLDVTRQGEALTPVPQTVLKIRKFRASRSFDGKELVYRTGDVQYDTDFYNEWFASPNAMLTQQVLNWLTAASLFQYVMDSSGALGATHILEGTVTALYGDLNRTLQRRLASRVWFWRSSDDSCALFDGGPYGGSITTVGPPWNPADHVLEVHGLLGI